MKPSQDTGDPTTPTAPAEPRCGVERWTVKTLQDSRASRVRFTPVPSTVGRLRLLEPPDIGRHSPRQTGEFTTYRVKVRLRSFKLEEDSDIHLVVSDPSSASKTMIVEFPHAGCVKQAGPTSRARMSRARRALIRACGTLGTGSFRVLDRSTTITGVAFFDIIHGQRGVAPNGIELHPALRFNGTCH